MRIPTSASSPPSLWQTWTRPSPPGTALLNLSSLSSTEDWPLLAMCPNGWRVPVPWWL